MFTKLKNQKGFTLVEVIVVAAIVAALAAAAVPMYRTYITQARADVVENQAGGIATFCAANRDRDGSTLAATYDGDKTTNKLSGAQKTIWVVPPGITAKVENDLETDGTAKITITHNKDSCTSVRNF